MTRTIMLTLPDKSTYEIFVDQIFSYAPFPNGCEITFKNKTTLECSNRVTDENDVTPVLKTVRGLKIPGVILPSIRELIKREDKND